MCKEIHKRYSLTAQALSLHIQKHCLPTSVGQKAAAESLFQQTTSKDTDAHRLFWILLDPI